VTGGACTASLIADKLFGPPAPFASESDEIRLGFPDLVPGYHHDLAAKAQHVAYLNTVDLSSELKASRLNPSNPSIDVLIQLGNFPSRFQKAAHAQAFEFGISNDFDTQKARSDLIALGDKHVVLTPIGHRCSNLMEQLEIVAGTTGDHGKELEKSIGRQSADLAKLTAGG
jgi:hypothetical protein